MATDAKMAIYQTNRQTTAYISWLIFYIRFLWPCCTKFLLLNVLLANANYKCCRRPDSFVFLLRRHVAICLSGPLEDLNVVILYSACFAFAWWSLIFSKQFEVGFLQGGLK